MSKRRAEDELTKDNQRLEDEEDDPRFMPVDPVKRASKDVLAGRSIAKPRSLLRGSSSGGISTSTPAANPFSASLGIKPVAQPAQAAPASQNPFSFLGSKQAAATPSFTAKPATSLISLSANPPVGGQEQPQKLKIAALNTKFAETIASYAKGNATGDWTKACQSYINYRQQINDSVKNSINENSNPAADVSMENEASIEQGNPTNAASSITSKGFKFASSSNDVGFSFGGKTIKNEAVENKPSGVQGFVFKDDAKKASELPFKVADEKPKEETNKEAKEKPAFSFGTPTTDKPMFTFGNKGSSESKFTFGEAKNDSSKFNFGRVAEDKPIFTFDQNAEEKPSFNFGGNSDKPKFSFGANSDDQKFQFSSSAAPSGDKPTFSFGNATSEKPKFIFGQAANDEKPKFTFGTSTAWTPGDKIKFDQPPSTEPKTEETKNGDEGADEDASEEAQAGETVDLSGKGPGEENEDAVYEKKAKVYELVDSQFKPVGLGNLRVLVDKETNKSRVLVRADGSGRVLVNIGLRKQLNYTHEGNGQVKILDFSAADKPPITYLVRVKTAADGEELKSKLEEVKN